MLDEVEVVDKNVVVVVCSLNIFLELLPTSQLRLSYIVPVHLSSTPLSPRPVYTPVHYTSPLHWSITSVHYTDHYTGPLHCTVGTQAIVTRMFSEALLEQFLRFQETPQRLSSCFGWLG